MRSRILRYTPILGVMLVTLAVASYASASTVTMSDGTGGLDGYNGSGGAFIAHSTGGYNGKTDTGNTFATFCVEENEYVYLDGRTFYTRISTQADLGGVGGPHPDPINEATAFLYASFRAGADLGGLGVLSTSTADGGLLASALQYAIWRNEEEVSATYNGESNATLKGMADTLYDWAFPQIGSGNFHGVRVLQLWNDAAFTDHAQDQLTLVPTPTASLAGSGLLGSLVLAGLLKKRRTNLV